MTNTTGHNIGDRVLIPDVTLLEIGPLEKYNRFLIEVNGIKIWVPRILNQKRALDALKEAVNQWVVSWSGFGRELPWRLRGDNKFNLQNAFDDVEVRYRDGSTYTYARHEIKNNRGWKHDNSASDILAYRFVPAEKVAPSPEMMMAPGERVQVDITACPTPVTLPQRVEVKWQPDPFTAYFQRQVKWSLETFGPNPRTKGILDHIRKELTEIEAAPYDLMEWLDVANLAMDGFHRHGGNPEMLLTLFDRKQRENLARNWPDWRTMSDDAAIEHDRTGE